jgi:hypothetical protein
VSEISSDVITQEIIRAYLGWGQIKTLHCRHVHVMMFAGPLYQSRLGDGEGKPVEHSSFIAFSITTHWHTEHNLQQKCVRVEMCAEIMQNAQTAEDQVCVPQVV